MAKTNQCASRVLPDSRSGMPGRLLIGLFILVYTTVTVWGFVDTVK